MNPFNDINISEILPQREPFLFVDRLVHYDERETVTAFLVPVEHLLVEDGHLTAAAGKTRNQLLTEQKQIIIMIPLSPHEGGGTSQGRNSHAGFDFQQIQNEPGASGRA